MTTILRSSKYIRCLNLLTRRIILNHDTSKLVKESLEGSVRCANSYLTKSYATNPALKRIEKKPPSPEKIFTQLDESVQRYGKLLRSDVEEALQQIRKHGNISSLDGLLLIRCCGNLLTDMTPQERNALVDDVWSTLETLNVSLDVSHFNALLRVYLENNYEFSPIEFLNSMNNKEVEANRVTYQRLILHYCKHGDIEGATKILEVMKDKGLPLNEAICSALITGHSEAGDMESAKNMLNVMTEAGLQFTANTYVALLCAYAKRGDMAAIMETMNESNAKNIYLRNADYFEVIKTLVANDHNQEVKQILPLIPKSPGYNNDAMHAILQILDLGNTDVAMQILSTMHPMKKRSSTPTVENTSGMFLIKKLVKTKFPPEQIIEACTTLEQRGDNLHAFSRAVQLSLLSGDTNNCIFLMEGWKRNGGVIREHYFWPLFVAQGKAGNYQGILEIVKEMISKFDIMPTFKTIKDYILPFTLGKWEDVVGSLRELRLPHDTIIKSIAVRMLTDRKIRKTTGFLLRYPVDLSPEDFYEPLTDAVLVMDDAPSYATILYLLSINSPDDEGQIKCCVDIVDTAIQHLLSSTAANTHVMVDKILEQLVEIGLSMSLETGNAIRELLGDKIDPTTNENIEKLTSGTLTPQPLHEVADKFGLEASSDAIPSRRSNPIAKRRELVTAIEKGDVAAVQQIVQELETVDFKFSPGIHAKIINTFCNANELELTEKWVNKYRTEYPDAVLDIQKSTNYAILLINNGRFEDAVKFISESPRKPNPDVYPARTKTCAKSLLDAAVATGDFKNTQKLFDALHKSKFMVIDNYMLGPLIDVHVAKNDWDGALEMFEMACDKFGCTPRRHELTKKFIEMEDAASLQRITDLSTEIHGERNSLIDLELAFIECGRYRQARKILETPGLRIRGTKLRNIIEQLINNDNENYLDVLIDLTKDLLVVDRQEFYTTLMTVYSAKNNWQCGLNLWATMQDENVQPSNIFLRTLSDLLKRNDQPIPFYCKTDELGGDEIKDGDVENQKFREFYRAIASNDLQAAEKLLERIPPHHEEYPSALSLIMMKCLEERDDWVTADRLANQAILNYGKYPRAHALKSLWSAYIDKNQFERLKEHGEVLTQIIKDKLRFHKFVSRALLKEVGIEKFLEIFKEHVAKSDGNAFDVVKNFLHLSSLIDEFKKNPGQADIFYSVAKEMTKDGVLFPMNVMWCYYFERNDREADVIWSEYFVDSPFVVYKHVMKTARANNDVKLAERLYEKVITNSHITMKSQLIILTTLVDLYNKNGRTEDAIRIVETLTPAEIKLWMKIHPIVVKKFRQNVQNSSRSLPSNFEIAKTMSD